MTMNTTAPGSASPTSAFFYDQGAFGAIPAMTKVNGVTVKAAVEIQSTEGGLLLPRMTTTQRLALTPVVDGMQVYDSTLGDIVTRKGGAWVQQNPLTGPQYASGTLTAAEINTAFTAALPLIVAPGANLCNVVKEFSLELDSDGTVFTGGGVLVLQFENLGAASGHVVSPTVPAAFLTGAGTNRATHLSCSFLSAPTLNYVNTPICLAVSAGNFAGGGASTLNWKIWYSVVPTA